MLEYLPPRIEHQITIDGFACPHIEARESRDGRECHVVIDGRFGAVIPATDAQIILWLLANAVAIGAGYSCHGENSQTANPHKVRVSEIETARRGD